MRQIFWWTILLACIEFAGFFWARPEHVVLNAQETEALSPWRFDGRTDLRISGVYPHLTAYGIYSQDGGHYGRRHEECGIGAIVPWAGKLWMVTYAPHMPAGSEHKLYAIDPDLSKPMSVAPESVGGTPAGRMIHAESQQLLIGHYLIDRDGNVRVISPKIMPMRVTAIARHLTDPEHLVYYVDMEGAVWQANVQTLAVKKLFQKPVPGWHGKGGYTSQGRLVVSNNGELSVGNYDEVLVGGKAQSAEEQGVLAEFDGQQWRIVERRQYTEVTGPNGITGGSDGNDPIWSVGWDRRSLRLKLLDNGNWYTYLLPKASYCNDASHGWYTEWPRIREISEGHWMMDMHGMFFDFPKTFSRANSAGIRPIGSHLRYVPDFCEWNGQLVLASDETSIQGNPLAGQPQSNLWFGSYEDLKRWGPASGYGGPWLKDQVSAGDISDPFLIDGFDRRLVHLAVDQPASERNTTSDEANGGIAQPVTITIEIDRLGNDEWERLDRVSVPIGGYVPYNLPRDLQAVWIRFRIDQDAVVTAFLHLTTSTFIDGNEPGNKELFSGLADVEEANTVAARVYAAKRNRNLRVISGERFFEFSKEQFEFDPDAVDGDLDRLLRVKPEFSVDAASVVIEYQGTRYRLPKGDPAFDKPFSWGWPRAVREVESERELANIHGTFYELPLIENGAPPLWNLIRPVSSHRKQIADFCSWNGLLVLSGVRDDARPDGHVFADAEQKVALWFGGVDDLWKFGKPVGRGGPWLNSPVQASVPSDPYLIRGYDRKVVSLSHESPDTVSFMLQIDIDGHGLWADYRTLEVPAGQTVDYEFPESFSAAWIRVVSTSDTTATAQFVYE